MKESKLMKQEIEKLYIFDTEEPTALAAQNKNQ